MGPAEKKKKRDEPESEANRESVPQGSARFTKRCLKGCGRCERGRLAVRIVRFVTRIFGGGKIWGKAGENQSCRRRRV